MANQYEADPRQLDFLQRYLNPDSKTYSNAYQSALDSGYSEEYAKNLKSRVNWLSESVKSVTKDELVTKAKKVLKKSLDSQDEKLAQDTAKFVAKTDVEFSEKVDPNSIVPQTVLVKFIGDNDSKDN